LGVKLVHHKLRIAFDTVDSERQSRVGTAPMGLGEMVAGAAMLTLAAEFRRYTPGQGASSGTSPLWTLARSGPPQFWQSLAEVLIHYTEVI
jgi:hypothetical protein